MRFDAILFDFDGVLIESEQISSRQIAEALTALGHPITAEEAMGSFMGLAGPDFVAAVQARIGGAIPPAFYAVRREQEERAIAEGIAQVAGAVAFVRALPADLPIAVVSSSSTRWIAAHLGHLGLAGRFGGRIVSGREHVARGKPAPDIYLYGADLIGVPIARCAIIEDSPVGVTGAVKSGAFVIGLVAGSHCGPGHAARLMGLGADMVARDFAEVSAAISG